MIYKVCILAAGVGTRMEPFTQHINKSLVPVDSKAVISHIIEKFDKSVEFIVAIGHLKETVVEYLECAHNDRKIKIVEVDRFIGKGSGPGYSLMQCRKELDAPFIFFAADTIVLEDIPPPLENWLGVSPVSNTKDYCTARISNNRIMSLDDKIVSKNENAFIGVAGVKDYEVFFNSLKKDIELKNNELQVSNGFKGLIKHNLKANLFTWYDTGNLKNYVTANNALSKSGHTFDFSKTDEFLYFTNNNVIKYFKDKLIVENRYKRAKLLNGLCPEIDCIKKYFYSYKKIDGDVLYDVANDQIMHDLMNWLDKSLWVQKKITGPELVDFKASCFKFYYTKTLSRLKKYHKKHQLLDKSAYINDVNVPSLKKMFELIDWDYLSCGIVSNFHGDLQFDNILLKDDGGFLLLDWRQDFSGLLSYGDQYYDLAKLNGGMKISYKLIKQNKFLFREESLNRFKISHETPKELNSSKEIFDNFLNKNGFDSLKVNILTSLIFLNMSPMHHEPFDHFVYNFGKLSLYKALLESGKIV
jgi:dTDP-glucose pyrophosphorylase